MRSSSIESNPRSKRVWMSAGQKQSVRDMIRLWTKVRADVRGFERINCVAIGDRAATPVRFDQPIAESGWP